MKILREVADNPKVPNHANYVFFCPGCRHAHGVWTKTRNGMGATWAFNGDVERPTFSPSILIQYGYPIEHHAPGRDSVCHSFVRDGQIEFLSDCTHALAGKTVPLEKF